MIVVGAICLSAALHCIGGIGVRGCVDGIREGKEVTLFM